MGPSTALHGQPRRPREDLPVRAAPGARLPTSRDRPMSEILDETALKQLFLDARTTNKFQPRAIDDATLQELVALMKWGPTSMNSQPGRIVFVRSPEGKAKSNFLINLGYGDPSGNWPRGPRLPFETMARIA